MKTKNIAKIVWELLETEIKRTNGKIDGSDDSLNGEPCFLYEFENSEIKGKIMLFVDEVK